MFNWLFKKHLCQMTPEQQLAKEAEGVEFFEGGVFEMKIDSKPHITKHHRLLDGKVYYKCSTNKWEAYGDTPTESYEAFMREWIRNTIVYVPIEEVFK